MIKKILWLILPAFLSFINLYAQDEDILLTIGSRKISSGEFLRMFKKNNIQSISEKQDLDEYLQLFINFKLKVIEAENIGLDTSSSFINELEGYVDQLAKPHLTDSAVIEELMKESYRRMQEEIHASHIVLMLDERASPEDTLTAYNRIMEIRNRALKGEDFALLAKTYSQDPSVVNNSGDLGWFSAFRMPYSIESAAYGTTPGNISMPVRSSFGYHILKVHEQRPAKPRLHVAHIFVRAPESMTEQESEAAKAKIFSAYEKLNKGEDFGTIARSESEDRSTGIMGGELPWFSAGEMIPVFENAAYAIKEPGQFSQPVQSSYGWHIIKLLERRELKTYPEEKPGIIQMFSSGEMQAIKHNAYITKLKKDYDYSFSRSGLDIICDLIDTSIFMGKWNNSEAVKKNDFLFSLGDKVLKVSDFAEYLYQNQRPVEPHNLKVFINDQFKTFSELQILKHEREMLALRDPEFAMIIQEYHDGMLLFDLTDKMVWSKAIMDTSGLKSFYSQNKDNYTWGERAEAFVITGKDKEIIDKAKNLCRKTGRNKKFSESYLKTLVCPDDTSDLCFTFVSGKFEKGDKAEVDLTEWKKGICREFVKDDETGFVYIRRILPPQIKKLDEARGLVTADYQTYLEKEWIKSLRTKYPVKINDELLKKLKQSDG